jgi:hypothetical protein
LEKGTYTLEKTLVVDKDLTIQAADGDLDSIFLQLSFAPAQPCRLFDHAYLAAGRRLHCADCELGDVIITAKAPTDTGHFAARADGESLGIMVNCKGFIPEVCMFAGALRTHETRPPLIARDHRSSHPRLLPQLIRHDE